MNNSDQIIENGLLPTVEANRYSFFFGCRQHGRRGVRATDLLGALLSKQAKRPRNRHSVRENQISGIQQAKKSRVVNSFHDHVNTGEEEHAGLLLFGPENTVLNHLFIAADSNVDA
jgi:hypothetical protein